MKFYCRKCGNGLKIERFFEETKSGFGKLAETASLTGAGDELTKICVADVCGYLNHGLPDPDRRFK